MYKMIKQGKQFCSPIKKFVCDNFEELENITQTVKNIPYASVAYVSYTKTYYVYNSEEKWIEVKGVIDYV